MIERGPGWTEPEGLRFPWSRSERPVPRLVLRPLQSFLETEAAGGIMLLAAAIVALVWANSPFREAYEDLWHTELALELGTWSIVEDLRGWVNEGLMTLFFFVVGLEIKRELVSGELTERRAAALPAIAALGGMVVPALIYLAFNPTGDAARGWGIPMATDIAFALGVLALVGRGLPTALKSFLLALAIVDDIGAIVVIAIFYTGQIHFRTLSIAIVLLGVLVVLRQLQVRWVLVYVVIGAAAWLATFEAGIEPTIVGAVLGLLTPADPFQRPRAVSAEAHRVAEETTDEPDLPDYDAPQWLHLAALSREAVSPLARLESVLHPWTSYAIVPLFALANAGLPLDASQVDVLAGRVSLGVIAGLVLGKPLGIALFSWLAVRLGAARLPVAVRWSQVVGVGAVAGIGFTVALFISGLAFEQAENADAAKLGILAASIAATLVGMIVLRAAKGR